MRKLFLAAFLCFAVSLAMGSPSAIAQTPDSATPMKVGGDVLPPKLIHSVEPKYPRPIFHKPKPSEVLVGITIPVDGIPTNIHILSSGGKDFDKNALAAVSKYRFQPATLHGNPVPVAIAIKVQFRIY